MTRALVLALLLLLCCPGILRADSSGAKAAFERALMALDQAAAAPQEQRAPLVAQAISALEAEPSLAADGWFMDPLRAQPPDIARARGRVSAATRALNQEASVADSAAARRALSDILNGPPFVTRDFKDTAPVWAVGFLAVLDWILTLLANVVRWPFDRLRELLYWFRDGPAFLPFVTLVALAAIACLLLLYRRGLRAALVSNAAVPESVLELAPTSAEAGDRAQRLAAEGRFREACHYLFLSALLWIEEHGHARFDRAATNREHLAQLEPDASMARLFRPLVDRFDRLWYGQMEASSGDYRELETLVARVKQASA